MDRAWCCEMWDSGLIQGGGTRWWWEGFMGLCTLSVDAARSGVQSGTWLHDDSEASLCCVEPFLRTKQATDNRQKEKNLIIRNDKLATRVLTLSSTQVLLGNWNVPLQLLIFRKMGVGVGKRMSKPVPLVPQ